SEQEQTRIFAEQDKNLADIDAENKDVYLIYKFLLSVRQNTLFGYFTSEKVGKEVLNYDPIPDRYDGCVPLADIGNGWTV
ncbi:MAG: gluconate 2-dehydrogenase subunit 3 family protein, partial [Pseudomonadales bacterium]